MSVLPGQPSYKYAQRGMDNRRTPFHYKSVTACASSSGFNEAPRKSSMIVPVYISHCSNPTREVLSYAMLDGQSDASFITEGTARALGLTGKGGAP